MGFFGCLVAGILFAFLLVLGLGLFVLQRIMALFGIRLPIEKFIRMKTGQPFDFSNNRNYESQQKEESTTNTSSASPKKQLYGDNEGEYVEFEEIKD
ncbi:MAG: DUF4834 family protein [Bacteroidaceae bacterium]|nr:DUF4834 family protein [Bacteroidaceae bacterium]